MQKYEVKCIKSMQILKLARDVIMQSSATESLKHIIQCNIQDP